MKYIILFTLFISSCSHGQLEIQISKDYEGPVAIIECNRQNLLNDYEIVKIDSIGLGMFCMNSNSTSINITDENKLKLAYYNPDQESNKGKMIFTFGKSTLNGYCGESNINYIYFFVGSYASYQTFLDTYEGDELLFFEKNNIQFCEVANGY